MSYRELEVYKTAHMLILDIHKMILTKLPRFEMFEEGTQIRKRLSKIIYQLNKNLHLHVFLCLLIEYPASRIEDRESSNSI